MIFPKYEKLAQDFRESAAPIKYRVQGAGSELRYKIQISIVCLCIISLPFLGFYFVREWGLGKQPVALGVASPTVVGAAAPVGQGSAVAVASPAGTVLAGVATPTVWIIVPQPSVTRDRSHPLGITSFELTQEVVRRSTATAIAEWLATPVPTAGPK